MAKESKNTTAKGDAFEERVFKILQKLLQTESLPINCKRSQIYCKKKYTSKESKKDIVFDIAIESFMPDSEEIANLTLIECKDYASPIEDSKIRDFIFRMNEVGANKGYFFTTSRFQSGVLEIAKANRVGLVVVGNTDELHWKTRRVSIRDKNEVYSDVIKTITGLSSERNYPFVAIGEDDYYTNFFDFLHDDIGLQLQQSLSIDYLTNEQILDAIYNESQFLQSTYFTVQDADLLKLVSKKGYSVNTATLPDKVLGEIDFESKTILVSDTLQEGSPRWRFTVAHELGHIVLHSKAILQSNIKAIEEYIDDEMAESANISNKTITRMEIQANSFASLLLLPPHQFELAYKALFIKEGVRNYPELYLKGQKCNVELSNWMIQHLSAYFNVSKAVILRRLTELDYLR
ncbi:MAG: ImmA/IrrE family metallo-endopeptidase [Bacteroidales bacterium]|nr:ImmA/IrrE family metallo-endopeptidase [Bacteroidales bacterium]